MVVVLVLVVVVVVKVVGNRVVDTTTTTRCWMWKKRPLVEAEFLDGNPGRWRFSTLHPPKNDVVIKL
jgi:hypothetical protein